MCTDCMLTYGTIIATGLIVAMPQFQPEEISLMDGLVVIWGIQLDATLVATGLMLSTLVGNLMSLSLGGNEC